MYIEDIVLMNFPLGLRIYFEKFQIAESRGFLSHRRERTPVLFLFDQTETTPLDDLCLKNISGDVLKISNFEVVELIRRKRIFYCEIHKIRKHKSKSLGINFLLDRGHVFCYPVTI